MGYIIDFIFSNLFFFILIIGGIISVINRHSKTKPNTNEREPTFNWEDLFDPETYQRERPPSPKPSTAETVPAPPPSEPVTTSPQTEMEAYHHQQMEALKRKKEQAEERLKRIATSSSPIYREEQSEKATPSSSNDVFSITEKEVAQGVIWAEILGEPVAKRRYHLKRKSL